MAFVPANLKKILSLGFSGGGSLWTYTSSDSHGTVEANNYFTGCGFGSPGNNSVGMNIGDLVAVVCVATSGTSAVTWSRVTSISTSTGWGGGLHASISAASS